MESGYAQIYVMNADGSNIVNLTQNETGYSPVWSPDGNKIAFTSDRNTGVDDIYLMNADGSNVVNLTQSSNSLDQLPAWSPDGNQIIFRSTRDWEPLGSSEPYYDYYIMKADGTNQSKLMSAGYEPSSVDSSTNVPKLVYALDLDVSRIHISDLDGSNPSIIGSNNIIGFDPQWSSDGTQILFSARTSNSKEIAVMEADGSNLTYLTNLGVGSIHPKWQPLIVKPPVSCDIVIPMSD